MLITSILSIYHNVFSYQYALQVFVLLPTIFENMEQKVCSIRFINRFFIVFK